MTTVRWCSSRPLPQAGETSAQLGWRPRREHQPSRTSPSTATRPLRAIQQHPVHPECHLRRGHRWGRTGSPGSQPGHLSLRSTWCSSRPFLKRVKPSSTGVETSPGAPTLRTSPSTATRLSGHVQLHRVHPECDLRRGHGWGHEQGHQVLSQATYHYGDVVQLTAVPQAGETFGIRVEISPGAPTLRTSPLTATRLSRYVQLHRVHPGCDLCRGYRWDHGPGHQVLTRPRITTATWCSSRPYLNRVKPSSWGGDLGGSTNPENITIDGNKTVTATFNHRVHPECDLCWGHRWDHHGVTGSAATYHYGDVVQLTAVLKRVKPSATGVETSAGAPTLRTSPSTATRRSRSPSTQSSTP